MTRPFSICAALVLASTTLCDGVSGSLRLLSVFEMDRCIGDASLIVRGLLDEKGDIMAQEVFKGEQPTNVLAIADGARTYQWLQASMTTDSDRPASNIEVVAFLGGLTKDVWQAVSGYAGIAGMENTNVYLFGYGENFRAAFPGGQPTAGRDEQLDREGFLAAVREQVKLSQQRASFLAMPRSAERAHKLVALFVAHPENYNRQQIAQSLRPINSEESQELLKEIAGAGDVAAKCTLIDLAGDLPLSKDAFDSIAPLIDAQNPRQLRRAAMSAISRINPPEATKCILPLIHIAEPELDMALVSLGRPKGVPVDLQVVEALLSLSAEIRQQDANGVQCISADAQRSLQQELAQYAHPKLVSFYFAWLPYHPSQAQDYLTSDLQAMLRVQWPRSELETWWKRQSQIAGVFYNLQESQEQRKWFDAYERADDTARHMLLQWWSFSSATDQLALVKAATEERTADAAKAAITKLWKDDRFGNEGKKAMFETFVRVAFVSTDLPNASGRTDQHQLSIILTFDFPFDTYVDYRFPVALDGRVSEATVHGGGGFLLQPKTMECRLFPLGGYVPGFEATATLEIFQLDYSGDGKELWRAQWQLGPIKLRDK